MYRSSGSLAFLAILLSAAGCGPPRGPTAGGSAGSAGSSFSVSVSRPQGGTIQSLGPNGLPDGKINCGTKSPSNTTANACGPASYDWTDTASFAAIPDDKFKFVSWAADCLGDGPCAVDTTSSGADKWIAAAFAPTALYRGHYFLVTVYPPNGGTVTSADGKIYCGSVDADANRCGPALYDWSAAAVLSANAGAERAFTGWAGDCQGSGKCTLTTASTESDKTVRANFGEGLSVRLSVTGLSDRGLKVANLDGSVQGIAANGTFLLGGAASGTPYDVIVTSHPPTQVCTMASPGGVLEADDVLVEMACACKDQLENCDGAFANGCESNVGFDTKNCGACGNVCPAVPNGVAACSGGACGIGRCDNGYTQANGTCIPVARSCPIENGRGMQHWGGAEYGTCNVTSCDAGYSFSDNACIPTVIACDVANGSGTSTFGTNGYGPCIITACDAGFDDCDGNLATGCEASQTNDVNNCGTCGLSCGNVANGDVACVDSACVLASCDDGFVPFGVSCMAVQIACPVANGAGVQTWEGTGYSDCSVTSCNPGHEVLDGECVPTQLTCTLPNATGTQTLLDKVYGPCVVDACSAGFANCDGASATGCEVVLSSLESCGACNNSCPAVANGTAACNAGVCGVAGCDSGFTHVNGKCIPATLPCNVLNGVGTQIWNGANYGACLVTSCDPGYHAANGVCARDVIDCFLANGAGTQTWNGTTYGACTLTSCSPGFQNCDETLANGCEKGLQTDVNNCGACGNVCPAVPNGTAACNSGVCGTAACGAGYTLAPNGSCVLTAMGCSVTNGTGQQSWNGSGYGECTVTSCNSGYHVSSNACASNVIGCTVANAIGSQTWNGSTYGACTVVACGATFGNCDGLSANGCEVPLQDDVDHCGACNRSCPVVANGTRSCTAGVCGVESCNAGYSFSGSTCVPTTVSCPIAHGAGTKTWSAGAYGSCSVATCDAGYHVANNACEPNVIACEVANASGTKTWNGTNYAACEVASCDASFTNCDGASENGCEAVLQTDADNCGSCGNRCPAIANGTRACTAGACGAASCEAGFTLVGNSCMETEVVCPIANGSGTKTWNGSGYGACVPSSCAKDYHIANNACEPDQLACSVPNGSGTRTWNGSTYAACAITACSAGHEDCDGDVVSGCEVVLQTSVTNCGSCGNACTAPANATATCNAGQCASWCNAGFHAESGGCVSDIRTCSSSTLHQEGTQTWDGAGWTACVYTSCSASYLDCKPGGAQGQLGCETDYLTDKQNCGGCNTNCGNLKICVNGACQPAPQ